MIFKRVSKLKYNFNFRIIETMIYGAMVVGQSAVFTSDYQKAKISAANMFRLIDRQPFINTNNNIALEKPEKCNGNLSFRGVHFTYPNRPDAKVLNGLSFTVAKGETVALVGSSGCGKSTSIQLIERFYDCSKGKIVI
jgi:ATP-binding cassette subfamily B (MDR/TAP) protein 1